MNSPLLEPHFARTGVNPLTSAFAAGYPPRKFPQRSAPAAPAADASEPDPAAVEHVAKLKAAMPAHALRIFEAWQAAPENSTERAVIESAMPAHALRALATLAAAMRETHAQKSGVSPGGQIPGWADVVASSPPEAARQIALYAHFPFCAARCAFCPFYRYADPSDWRPYHDALLSEIELAAAPFAQPPPLAAIYFGGGTPSDLPGDALASLVKTMRARFRAGDDTEITVEGRPSTLDPEKVSRLRAAGVNRFSLGVQTFAAFRAGTGRATDASAASTTASRKARATSSRSAAVPADVGKGATSSTRPRSPRGTNKSPPAANPAPVTANSRRPGANRCPRRSKPADSTRLPGAEPRRQAAPPRCGCSRNGPTPVCSLPKVSRGR